jgi:hypothetical protein
MLQSQDKKWAGNEILIHIKQKYEDAINCEDEELVAKRVFAILILIKSNAE